MAGHGDDGEVAFDESRFKPQAMFKPMVCGGRATPLSKASLAADEEMIVFEASDERRVVSARSLTWPHIARGTANGEPFTVAFCGVCHSATAFTPIVDGQTIDLEVRNLAQWHC